MKKLLCLTTALSMAAYAAGAAEIAVNESQRTDTQISVYKNMALVKDSRNIYLPAGESELSFEGVAERMRPETAVLLAVGVNVLEQNYDYNLITAQNLMQKYVGKKVKTAVENPKTGETVFSDAEIVSQSYGTPVLKFSYGIDPSFNGRIIYPEIPADLQAKPSLAAKIMNETAAQKEISLMYLTGGLSWDSNYVATLLSDSELNLKGWVTVNNVSGIDYKNAKISFVAGNVNEQIARPIMAKGMRMMAMAANTMDTIAEAAAMPDEQSLAGYHMYNIPFRVDLAANQTKQLSLLEGDMVKYHKNLVLNSPLYFGQNSASSFEKSTLTQSYVINNSTEDNLGIPLPSGTVRFYQRDKDGNLQFIGEDRISHTPKNEELKLNLGDAFDVFASGSITSNRKVSENVSEFEAKVKFTNSSDKDVDVVFKQSFPAQYKILSENMPGESKDIRRNEWKFKVEADKSVELNFGVQIIYGK